MMLSNAQEMPEIAAVALGLGFLHIFYRAVQLNWPESYFGATELSTYAVATSPVRYALFRFGPVFLACLFVAVSLDRAGRSGLVGSLVIGVAHSLTTTGRALVQAALLPSPIRRHRVPTLIVWGVVFLGVMLTAALAGLVSGYSSAFVPDSNEIVSSLWTGLIAGVLGAYLAKVSRGHAIDEYEMADESRRRIPRHLWDLVGQEAITHAADPDLARAVMLVENLQRPHWFRALERARGRFVRRGTYGIMQVMSDRPLTDEESIKKAVRERLAGVTVKNEHGYLDRDALATFARSYNPNPNFRSLLEGAYNTIYSQEENG